MISGKLDRRITINQLTEAQVSGGGMTNTWSALVSDVPARVEYTGAGESVESDQRVAGNRIVFAIRYPRSFTPTAKMQVVYETKDGNIISVEENTKAGRRVEMLLTVEFKDNG